MGELERRHLTSEFVESPGVSSEVFPELTERHELNSTLEESQLGVGHDPVVVEVVELPHDLTGEEDNLMSRGEMPDRREQGDRQLFSRDLICTPSRPSSVSGKLDPSRCPVCGGTFKGARGVNMHRLKTSTDCRLHQTVPGPGNNVGVDNAASSTGRGGAVSNIRTAEEAPVMIRRSARLAAQVASRPPPPAALDPSRCPVCGGIFKGDRGVRMHRIKTFTHCCLDFRW